MKSHAVRIPEDVYEAVRLRAETERRSLTQQIAVLLTTALATEVKIVPIMEPWPEPEPEVPVPSAAEIEYATGDPIDEPMPEPEPIFVRVDDVEPDFKKGKR